MEGNYLMHKSGVRGYLQNNFQFSKCSYHNISVFMSSMKKQDRYCFEPNGKFLKSISFKKIPKKLDLPKIVRTLPPAIM